MMRSKSSYTLSKVFGLLFPVLFLTGCNGMVVFQPKGPVARDEAFLISTAFSLMLIVVIPAVVLAILFAIRYRASSKSTAYEPNWKNSFKIELLVWLVPIAIVMALAFLSWTSTYRLDPYRPIKSTSPPLRVEVVSLDWNWLFIYPDYHIASVNELTLPVDTPLDFRLTSATVMTSFFIPQLGGQMYAMAGMKTHLHLMADETGVFDGHNQEFSGRGYSTMHFKTIVTTPEGFDAWIRQARKSPDSLGTAAYNDLSRPGSNRPVRVYSAVEPGLFDLIVGQFARRTGAGDSVKTRKQRHEHLDE